jgi:hypothetical protein
MQYLKFHSETEGAGNIHVYTQHYVEIRTEAKGYCDSRKVQKR